MKSKTALLIALINFNLTYSSGADAPSDVGASCTTRSQCPDRCALNGTCSAPNLQFKGGPCQSNEDCLSNVCGADGKCADGILEKGSTAAISALECKTGVACQRTVGNVNEYECKEEPGLLAIFAGPKCTYDSIDG